MQAVPGVADRRAVHRRVRARQPPPPKVVDGLVRIDATLADPADCGDAARHGDRSCARAVARGPRRRREGRRVHRDQPRRAGHLAARPDGDHPAGAGRDLRDPRAAAALARGAAAAGRDRGAVVPGHARRLRAWSSPTCSASPARTRRSRCSRSCSWSRSGIDYNIFLMTRVREEAAKHGHRAGTLRGLCRHRRRDHLGRRRARGHLRRAGRAAAGVPGRRSPSPSRSACCWTRCSSARCSCPR